MNSRRVILATFLLALCAGLGAPGASAQPPEGERSKRLSVRVFGAGVFSRGETATAMVMPDSTINSSTERVTYDVGNGFGLGVGIEYRIVEHIIGIELGVHAVRLDTEFRLDDSTGVMSEKNPLGTLYPMTLGINFHVLNPEHRADLYLAPVLSWIFYDESSSRFTTVEDVEFDNDFGVGFDVGLNYALGEGTWFLSGTARFLALQTTARTTLKDGSVTAPTTVDVDPFVLGLGLGLRL